MGALATLLAPTAAAAKTTTANKAMPAEVRVLLPRGATSLYLGRLPLGAGGKPMLVHLWAAGRKRSPATPHQFDPSPFCVDVFHLAGRDEFEPGKWHLVASTVYLGEDGPHDAGAVSARWLQPAKKQAPVLIIVSPSYISTRFTVITFPGGISPSEENKSYVQEFYQGGLGGGKTVYDFGLDARGTMTVVEESSYQGRTTSTTVLSWNGRGYVAPPAKR